VVEHVTFNHGVEGSSPSALTKENLVQPGHVGRPTANSVAPPFICEKFTRERWLSESLATEYFERYPKDRYQTEVDIWRNPQSADIDDKAAEWNR
jgi:hypothetical protein